MSFQMTEQVTSLKVWHYEYVDFLLTYTLLKYEYA